METVTGTAACACFIGLAAAAASMLCPDEKASANMKTILGLIFMITLVSGIVKADFENIIPAAESFDAEEHLRQADSVLISEIERSAAAAAGEEFVRRGFGITKISVHADISENNSIYISEAELMTDKNTNSADIIETAKEILGRNVKITVRSEAGGTDETDN